LFLKQKFFVGKSKDEELRMKDKGIKDEKLKAD